MSTVLWRRLDEPDRAAARYGAALLVSVIAGAIVLLPTAAADARELDDWRDRVVEAQSRLRAAQIKSDVGRASAESKSHGDCDDPDRVTDSPDSLALDIERASGGVTCGTDSWIFVAQTYDTWELDELDYFIVLMDTDRNSGNGCGGNDWFVFAEYVGGDDIEATLGRTPSCDSEQWTRFDAIGSSATSVTIGVGVSSADLNYPETIRWNAALASIYDDNPDVAPNAGYVTSTDSASQSEVPPPSEPSPSPPKPSPSPSPTPSGGYVLLADRGAVYAHGAGRRHGDGSGLCATIACASIAVRPSFDGYWIANGRCEVGNFGAAPSVGSPNLGSSCALERSASGAGYWAVTASGAVHGRGDAVNHGSAPAGLKAPIVDIARAGQTGSGYWLLGQDGGIFTFGSAAFHGSTGAMSLNQPVVGMTATPTGRGYWLVASDGGIFTFGDAAFYGSTGAMTLNRPIIGMVATPSGRGYWLVASDGGVFTFGDAAFLGSPAGQVPTPTVVGFAAA